MALFSMLVGMNKSVNTLTNINEATNTFVNGLEKKKKNLKRH